MSIRNVRRAGSIQGPGTGTSAPLYVNSSDNKLKMIPAGSGSTEVEIIDASSVQTLTNKTISAPTPPTPTTYSVDGAITIATSINKITKGSAAALTLAAPTAAQEGTRLTVVSDSAFAHVITATGLLNDGVTGGAKNTATFAAFAGAAIELVAINLKWAVANKNVVTIA